MVMYDNEFETRDKISEDKIEPHHTYSISCGDTDGAMVIYDNEFETRDKISKDKIEPHHTYSISYGDTEVACVASVSNRVIARKLERKQKKG